MKITHINEHVTAVPHIPSIEKSRPGDYRERPMSIIEVHTDEGIVGIGAVSYTHLTLLTTPYV